jgi:hypothetical protein
MEASAAPACSDCAMQDVPSKQQNAELAKRIHRKGIEGV